MKSKIYDYLERLGSVLRSESRPVVDGTALQPVQINALYYLSICNRYSDTPLSVTDYLNLTKGTVSQTLKVLETYGLIKKIVDNKDKRQVHLNLTGKGKKLLMNAIPPNTLNTAVGVLNDMEQNQLQILLHKLLIGIQTQRQMRSFGICKTCRHNGISESGSYFCQLTQEPLKHAEIELICREHELDKP